jgi:hypothetical protein
MIIADVYSHFNGLEFLHVRKPALWEEVVAIISAVNFPAARGRTNDQASPDLRAHSFCPTRIAGDFSDLFRKNKWNKLTTRIPQAGYDGGVRANLCLQKKAKSVSSYNQTDFVKDRVAIEVQFGKYAFVAYDLFVKHLAFYVRDQIDVGIEILPMKSLQAEMSSGPGYYEGELYNVIRNGRGVPAVPLVMIGIAP